MGKALLHIGRNGCSADGVGWLRWSYSIIACWTMTAVEAAMNGVPAVLAGSAPVWAKRTRTVTHHYRSADCRKRDRSGSAVTKDARNSMEDGTVTSNEGKFLEAVKKEETTSYVLCFGWWQWRIWRSNMPTWFCLLSAFQDGFCLISSVSSSKKISGLNSWATF